MSVPAADLSYASDMQEALLADHEPGPRRVLWLVAGLLVAALAWAAWSRVEEITQGPGRVVPSSREQLVQSLEGGIVQAMLVREGEVVERGQPLLRIDPTRADASWREGESRRLALRATAARLTAESQGVDPGFPPDVVADPGLVRTETAAYLARRRTLQESTATLTRSRELLGREIALTQPMVERGLVAEVELLRMRRQFNEIELQIAERTNRFRAEAAAELARVTAELAQVDDVLTARRDQLDRTVVRAPMRGTVSNVKVTTVGGVIQPGQDIMAIVPLDDQLLVEARIAPHEVAFLRPGLPAKVKLTAYDYTTYGWLEGTVDMISADTLRDEHGRNDENYYRVLVRTQGPPLRAAGRVLPVIPGMTARVEIRTGEKRVLDYLLKPVFRAREALRER
ncbi:MAG: HlyD family type I secretion periplasmic adaptor subunit [Steroidobacteraceae bacterium]|nr:HlyD family type I secretion periplasmic adaptor subunit [Nevskiaceae bacterium]MCP5339600.1 HlyD family type I secretion periplasmic adaptor subunit [Nevskiaceae bacterium]MCP5472932.1 HlyD family type I secretion periplasmic adaptor subunit [Nevskiaceae bacterium]